MSEHTPGPWAWDKFPHHDPAEDQYEVIYHDFDNGHYLHFSGVGRAADARLMAAAPDLLDALEDATRELIGERDCLYESVSLGDGTIPDPEDKAVVAEMDRVIDKAWAALAKARGEAT